MPSNILRAPVNPDSASSDLGGASSSGTEEANDTSLVVAAQSGDYTAFDTLVTKHRGKIYAMILNMVKNDADAWDLSQDTFIKAWKALPKFENRSKFSTWMFRIAHNVVYDWTRKKKIQSEGELDDTILYADRIDPNAKTKPSSAGQPDHNLERDELRREIEAAIAQLSPNHREVVLLREVQGLDYKEIATVMNCSVGTVMSRLFNARKKLKTILTQ